MNPYIVDVLEYVKKKIPSNKRDNGIIRYSIDEEAVRSNLEIIYSSSTGRISQLAYFIDASMELGRMEEFKPSSESTASDDFQISFNNYDDMPKSLAQKLNQQMGSWACNVVMRELCEYLHYYLLQVYETGLTIKLAGQDITADQVENIRKAADIFERKGLTERFQILQKEFEIMAGFRQELASLYEARHVFAHFDGCVQKKFCDNQGYLCITWPKNKYQLVKNENGKKIPYHKAARPIDPRIYSDFTITYFAKSHRKKYRAGERITLSPQDIQDLIFLFIYIFGQTHDGLVKFALKHKLSVKAFENYKKPSFMMMAQAFPQ